MLLDRAAVLMPIPLMVSASSSEDEGRLEEEAEGGWSEENDKDPYMGSEECISALP